MVFLKMQLNMIMYDGLNNIKRCGFIKDKHGILTGAVLVIATP